MNSGESGFAAAWLPELVAIDKRLMFWAGFSSEFSICIGLGYCALYIQSPSRFFLQQNLQKVFFSFYFHKIFMLNSKHT